MGTSDRIARFILDALESADGTAELQRSSLADRFGCVPSQINYVIATRFSPERGYMVESRRGGRLPVHHAHGKRRGPGAG